MARKTTFNLYIDFELIEMFERKVGKGNSSEIIEELVRNYLNVASNAKTKEDIYQDMDENDAMQQIQLDPYDKLKFEHEKSKDSTITAVQFLKRLNDNYKNA